MSERERFLVDEVAKSFDLPPWIVDPSRPIPMHWRVWLFIKRPWWRLRERLRGGRDA